MPFRFSAKERDFLPSILDRSMPLEFSADLDGCWDVPRVITTGRITLFAQLDNDMDRVIGEDVNVDLELIGRGGICRDDTVLGFMEEFIGDDDDDGDGDGDVDVERGREFDYVVK